MKTSKYWTALLFTTMIAGTGVGCALDEGEELIDGEEITAVDELPQDGEFEEAGVRSCRTSAINASGSVSLTVFTKGTTSGVSLLTWTLGNFSRTLARTDLQMSFQVKSASGVWRNNGIKFLRYDIPNGKGGANLTASITTSQSVRAKILFGYDQAGARVTRSCYVMIR